MKLAINTSVLLNQHKGIGVYTREIVNRLKSLDHDLSITQFTETSWLAPESPFPSGDGGGGAQSALGFLKEKAKIVPGARELWNFYKKQRFEAGKVAVQADVFWEPCFIPPGEMSPMVVTVHDLSHVRYPQFHPKSRVKWMEALEGTIERSAKVLTVSEFTKQEIVEVYGTNPDKIVVTHNGCAEAFLKPDLSRRDEVMQKYGLVDGTYLLSVATLEPRKNLATLLRAYNLLPASLQKEMPLVLVGSKGWGEEGDSAFYEKLCPGGNLIITDFVSFTDLPILYAGARSFAYPAIYEGFGIPPIEAMACNTPVLVSDIPVLNEVCGAGATYVSTLDEKDWAEKIQETLALGEADRAEKCQKGRERAAGFSWDQTAQKTYDVLKSVAT